MLAELDRSLYRGDGGQWEGNALAHRLRRLTKALSAEGIPASGGYGQLNKEPFIRNTLYTRGYQRIYGKDYVARWEQANRCPENDRLCEEAVWFTQRMFLGPRSDMDQIAEAVRKVHASAGDLAQV